MDIYKLKFILITIQRYHKIKKMEIEICIFQQIYE